jgi:primosomal protein N'
MYADVAVCLPLIRTFVYKLPGAVDTGCRVIVPFRKREVEGFVVGLRKDAPKNIEVYPVASVIDGAPLVRSDIFELCKWISEYYVAPFGEVLRSALPPGITAKHVERPSPGAARPPSPGGRGLSLQIESIFLEYLLRNPSLEPVVKLPGCGSTALQKNRALFQSRICVRRNKPVPACLPHRL